MSSTMDCRKIKYHMNIVIIICMLWQVFLCQNLKFFIFLQLTPNQIAWNNLFFYFLVYCIALYFVAIWSYRSIKRDIQRDSLENQRFDVAYTVTPFENKRLNQWCLLWMTWSPSNKPRISLIVEFFNSNN